MLVPKNYVKAVAAKTETQSVTTAAAPIGFSLFVSSTVSSTVSTTVSSLIATAISPPKFVESNEAAATAAVSILPYWFFGFLICILIIVLLILMLLVCSCLIIRCSIKKSRDQIQKSFRLFGEQIQEKIQHKPKSSSRPKNIIKNEFSEDCLKVLGTQNKEALIEHIKIKHMTNVEIFEEQNQQLNNQMNSVSNPLHQIIKII